MKTKNEILEKKYTLKTINNKEVVFSEKTPQKTAKKLIELIENRKRIVLDYGNIEKNETWNEIYDITGVVSLTKGHHDLYWPILVYNSRSSGGGLILTDCIIEIKESKGKKSIFKNEC